MSVCCEVRKKVANIGFGQVRGMSGVVKPDVAEDPADVCPFGMQAVAPASARRPDLIEEFGRTGRHERVSPWSADHTACKTRS